MRWVGLSLFCWPWLRCTPARGSWRPTGRGTESPGDEAGPGPPAALPALPSSRTRGCMGSPQSLSEADRRVVAGWAADCAEHVLALFLAEAPDDDRPRALHLPHPRVRAGRAEDRRGDPASVRRWCRYEGRDALPQRQPPEPPVRPSPSATWARTLSVPPLTPPKPPALRTGPARGRRRGDSLAARPHVGRGPRRPANAPACRSELVRTARARTSRVGPTRLHHP